MSTRLRIVGNAPAEPESLKGNMKTLANPNDKVEIITRLAQVLPGSHRRWGRMSAHQMICHLSDTFRSSMGEKQVSAASPLVPRPLARWVALRSPFKWPHGFPARLA